MLLMTLGALNQKRPGSGITKSKEIMHMGKEFELHFSTFFSFEGSLIKDRRPIVAEPRVFSLASPFSKSVS